MKILHVISGLDPQNGGPTIALTGMAKSQAAIGLAVSVLATWQETTGFPVADDLRSHGVQVRHVGKATGKLSRHPELAAITAEAVAAADVIHIHAVWEEVQHQAARASQRQRKPYIMLPHGMLSPWCLSEHRILKRLYMLARLNRDLNQASAMNYTTEIERDLAGPLHLKPPIIIEPPGLDLREFETLPAPGTFRAQFPQLNGKKIVLFLGRIDYKKGMNLLIPAFAKANIPETILVIAGPDSGGYRAKMESLIAGLGIADRVLFTGMLHGPDRIAALVDADLFALTSYQENFGIAVTESLAAGTPVLISDQVNIYREIATANVGAVVPTNVDAITTELSRWMNDPSLRQAAAGRARPWAMMHYDYAQIARRWCAHYQRIIDINSHDRARA